MSRDAAPTTSPATPGRWCGATWRSRSKKHGPGSTITPNRGNDEGSGIGPGAYPRYSASQRPCAFMCERRELVVAIEVVDRDEQTLHVVAGTDRDHRCS